MKTIALTLALLLLLQANLATAKQEPVAKIIASKGNVMAVNASAETRKLRRGARVYQGETVETDAHAKATLVFIDSGVVKLAADSSIKVEKYLFDKTVDKNNQASIALLKGGMQTVTGLIGSKKPENYKLKSDLAVIAIRGTHLAMAKLSNSLFTAVWQGVIAVTPTGQNVAFIQEANTPTSFAQTNSSGDFNTVSQWPADAPQQDLSLTTIDISTSFNDSIESQLKELQQEISDFSAEQGTIIIVSEEGKKLAISVAELQQTINNALAALNSSNSANGSDQLNNSVSALTAQATAAASTQFSATAASSS